MGKFQAYYKDAERLAVKEFKTQREISELLGISEKTLSRWSSDGEWLRLRKEYLVSTKTGPVEKLKSRFTKLLEDTELLDSKKTDEMYKIQLLIDRMEGGGNIKGASIEVMGKFSRYLNKIEPDKGFIERVGNHMHGFFEEIQRQ